jgi:hypothetical protein
VVGLKRTAAEAANGFHGEHKPEATDRKAIAGRGNRTRCPEESNGVNCAKCRVSSSITPSHAMNLLPYGSG